MDKHAVKEGMAYLQIMPGEIKKSDIVFYNPEMRINRDISSLAVQAFTLLYGRSVRVLDVMAATGVRGIRYALECENVKEVVFGDLNPHAVELIKTNAQLNNLHKYKVYKKDAGSLLHEYRFEGDVVDIDPFGSPVYYLEALGRCVSNKGLAMITFTDTAVLAGTYPRTAFRRYSVIHTKKYSPKGEIALRIALRAIAQGFAKFDKGIVPLLSIFHRHYVRVIVRVDKRKSSAEKNIENLKYMLFSESQHKEFCDISSLTKPKAKSEGKYIIGPLWSGMLGNSKFVDKMIEIATSKKDIYLKESINLLLKLRDEYSIEGAHYYDLPSMGKFYNSPIPSVSKIKDEVEKEGYKMVKSHIKGDIVVTNAPYEVLVNAYMKCVKGYG